MRKLKLLLATLALLVGGVSTASAYQTPTADGIYYLYNETTGKFMSRGATWGTRATIDDYGTPIKVVAAEGDVYKLTCLDRNSSTYGNQYWMYSDADAKYTFSFTPVLDGNYKIQNTTDWSGTGHYVYINEAGEGGFKNLLAANSADQVGLAEGMYLWKFLSQVERDELIASRIENNNIAVAGLIGYTVASTEELEALIGNADNFATTICTSSISSASLESSFSGWTYNKEANRNKDLSCNANGIECFEGCGTLTQSVTGLKKGLYKVTINGFHRDGSNADCYSREFTDGLKAVSYAYLDANGYRGQIKSWASDATDNSTPNSMGAAKELFNAGKYLNTVYTYVGDDGKLDLTIGFPAFNESSWYIFDNVTLTYYSDAVSDDEIAALVATIPDEGTIPASVYSNLTTLKNALESAKTIAAYNALNTAVTTALELVAPYAALVAEIAKAKALGIAAATADAYATVTTAAEATANTQALMVAEYNYVTDNYSHGVALGTWTTENATERSGQHWDGTDGTDASKYSEQNEGWGSKKWSCSYSQNLTLPAGKYVFKVAGRKSSDGAVLTLTVKKGETTLGTVNDFPNGDTGKGIDTKGATNFGEGNFANGGAGRGWQWRYVQFTLADPATVNVAVEANVEDAQYQWVGFCNATVQTDDPDNVTLMEALVALNSAKAEATLTKITANIGTGAFQLNESTNNSLWDAYETAKGNAEAYALTSSSTASEVNGLATDLTDAINDYKNQALNAPADDKLFNIVLVADGWEWDQKAITYLAGDREDEGNYNLKYKEEANKNLAQAFTFTKKEGNDYYLSQIDAEGNVRYITDAKTGYDRDGGDVSIRTTTDFAKAAAYTIIATATEGIYRIYNKVAKNYVGSQDAGVYTVTNKNDFKFVETTKPSIAINTAAAGWGTVMLPFAVATLPSGVKAYTCAVAEGATLTLVSVDALEANKPYIIEGAWNETKTGNAVGVELTYTQGLLTGVYAEQKAIKDTYVMQKQGDVVAFYKVAEGSEPTIGANRCYLTAPAAGARDAFFFDGATAIKAIETLTSGNAEIFDANGVRLPALKKGMNILKKTDGTTYKIMVK